MRNSSRKRKKQSDPIDHNLQMNKKDDNVIVIKNEPMFDTEELSSKKSSGHSLWLKIAAVIVCVLCVLSIFVILFYKHIYGYMNIKSFDGTADVVLQEEEFDTDDSSSYEELDPDEVQWNNSGDIKRVDGVTNILLVADDNEVTDSNQRSRSDLIIVATINTNDQSLKLTSFSRDTYVQVPGYKDNRISSAYRTGDIPLLEEVLEENFNLQVDGYILVDFEGFTDLIDELGGVEVTLTEEEADWLNEKDHILDKSSRNVKAGTHLLNGSQVLGYSRIINVKTANGLKKEAGRAWRQKLVLTTLFNNYKNQSITEIVSKAPDVLSLVTTDLTETRLLSLIMTAIDLNVNEIETLSIPVADSYERKSVRGMSVLVPDLEENINALDIFIYGSEEETVEQVETFSLTESNFSLQSIDRYTEVAFDVLKGYSKLTMEEIRRTDLKLEHSD